MTEERRAGCPNCGREVGRSFLCDDCMEAEFCLNCGCEVGGSVLCDDCMEAEFCLGCRRGNEARAAAAAAAGLNAQSVWCDGCALCSDCSGRVHCTSLFAGSLLFHGVCEGCAFGGGEICGACCSCPRCCECAPRAAPAVCARCNLRPGVRAGAPCDVCREAGDDDDSDDD